MGKGKGEKDVANIEEEEELDRGNWDNQCDFFLSCLGYAVGLGNVWRFPYLCYEHGGVTFLIAYLTMLLVSGLPLFFMELSLGQWAGKGPLKVFGRMAPIAKGLGYGMLMISFLVVIYYNLIIAWTIYYTFAGFTSELPWTYCGNGSLTSRDCYQREQAMTCYNESNAQDTFWNKKCTPVTELCQFFNYTLVIEDMDEMNETMDLGMEMEMKMKEAMCNNGTHDLKLNEVYRRVSPSEDYYKRTMLGLEEETDWSNMGGLKADLVGCLAAAWLIVCLCLIKGVQSSGKVVYFTALFPYFVLFILLIRGATLEGAYDGILFYVNPTPEKLEGLKDVKVWAAAATQIFYSLGPSFGGLITLASYNKFSNNCHRDAILIAFSNCATSIFAGFVIFSIVGFMANQAGVSVEDAIASGTGLAFIAYPEAVTQMPFPPIWSFLFFTMLITLGLDSQFTMVETITTAIMDQWPKTRAHKGKVVIGACVTGFLLGLTCTSRGGLFMFSLIDWYASSWGLLICAITEVLLVMYLYGWRNFMDNIEEMGLRIPLVLKGYWLSMWMVVTPAVLLLVFVMTFVQYSPAYSSSLLPGLEEKYVFPGAIQGLGIIMSFAPLIIIILGALYQVWKRKSQGKSISWKALTSPNEKWCSAVADKNKKRAGLSNATYMKDEVDITNYKYEHGM